MGDNFNEVQQGQKRRAAASPPANGRDPRRVGGPAVPALPPRIPVPAPSAAYLARQGQRDNMNERADGYVTEQRSGGYGSGYGAALKDSAVQRMAELTFARQYDQPPPPPSPYPNNNGGGGGGGGGVDPAKIDALLAQLQTAGDADRLKASQGFAGLDTYMAGLDNPYAHLMPAEAAQVGGDDLTALIRSQGGGDAGLMAQAQFLQAQNGAAAGASNQMSERLRAAQAAWNQGTRSNAQLAGQQVDGELAAQVQAMRLMLEAKKAGL